VENLLALRKELSEKGVLISFNGSFNSGIIEEIGRAIRTYLKEEKLGRGIISDVFAVYIEQTQNIRNYLANNGIETGPYSTAIVKIARKNGMYTISSGNSIRKEDVQKLSDYLESLNGMDKKELKQFYKRQLRKPANPEARSAGLGLIDISRKASKKLEFQFQHQDEAFDFFNLFVAVKGGV